MLGVGESLWAKENGDSLVRRLRDERSWAPRPQDNLSEQLWSRLVEHEGELFRTATGLPFRYVVEGTGIWFERDGARIDKRLARGDFEKAVSRLPLRKTTDISDCFDPSYLYGILTNSRIVRPADLAA